MTADPYLNPVTGVLINRLDIASPEHLQQVEADLTTAALADLGTRLLPGRYDLPHLRAFHREIFGDVYPWAGEIQVVAIAKVRCVLPARTHRGILGGRVQDAG